MPFEHVMQEKFIALWSCEEMNLVAVPSGWARRCETCSEGDPYNDWYLWDDASYIAAHCSLLSHTMDDGPAVWVGIPVAVPYD